MSEHAITLSAEDYWRLIAASRQVRVATLEAKWAIAKAESEFATTEAAIRETYRVPAGMRYRLDEQARALVIDVTQQAAGAPEPQKTPA